MNLASAAIYTIAIPLFTFCIYLVCAYFKEIYADSEKIAFWFYILTLVMVGLLLIFIGIVTFRLYSYFHKYTSKGAAATLTGSTFTVVSIIVTFLGILYTTKQNRIQKLHSESNWRGRLLDLEKKPFYTTNDLLELNSFINPYHTKNDDLDYLINSAITTILNNIYLHKDELHEFDDFYEDVKNSKVAKWTKKMFSNEKKYNNIFEFEEDIDIKKEKINPNVFENNTDIYYLNKHETVIIRKCIHALLKNDWIKVTR